MPVQSPAEVARAEGPDRLACLSYLTRLQDQLQRETPVITGPILTTYIFSESHTGFPVVFLSR